LLGALNLSRLTNGLAWFLVQQLVLAAPLKRHHPAETGRTDVRVHACVNVALP
jgi:hypothetical protein